MPGIYCAIASCSNSLRKTKITQGKEDIKFHCLPSNETLKKEWISVCQRDINWNPGKAHVCSEHFTPDDYERDLRNELLGLPIRRRLKKTAVPSLNLLPLKNATSSPVHAKTRPRKRVSKKGPRASNENDLDSCEDIEKDSCSNNCDEDLTDSSENCNSKITRQPAARNTNKCPKDVERLRNELLEMWD